MLDSSRQFHFPVVLNFLSQKVLICWFIEIKTDLHQKSWRLDTHLLFAAQVSWHQPAVKCRIRASRSQKADSKLTLLSTYSMSKNKFFAFLISENLAHHQTIDMQISYTTWISEKWSNKQSGESMCVVYFVIPARQAVFLSLVINVDTS